MSNVLTNNANTSIILTLNNVNSPEANVISMAPGESLLYDNVIVTDELDINYNVPLIQEYIDAGILLKQDISGITSSELQLLSQGNLVINLSTGIPKLISKTSLTNIDNLQILPISNINGNLQYIYYKSIQGMSISSDFGVSQTLISNDNLLYPDEITSFAVQIYDSNDGILQQVNRLYIGTLKEGVKIFTPGVDTTYVDFDVDAFIGPTDPVVSSYETPETPEPVGLFNPIFKNSITTLDGTTYTKKTSNFCATYVLAIINNPINTGCPIFIATRTRHTDSSQSSSYFTKIVCKYLHSFIYVNKVKTSTIYNNWILLQENDAIIDSSMVSSITFPQHILDIITEYIPTGALLLIQSNTLNSLYIITCTSDIISAPTIVEIPSWPIGLLNIKLKNISYLSEIDSNNYDIFITTDTTVWRYSSKNTTWEKLLYPTSTVSYFTTSITEGVLDVTGTANLKELSNFIVIPKNDTTNEYIGILGSELGLIQYNLKLVNNIFTSGAKVVRTLLSNVAKSVISDIKYSLYGQNIYVFTCSYSSQIPRAYVDNIGCLQLINDNTNLVKSVYYIKPDVETTNDSIYYVSEDSQSVNYIPSNEQKSSVPVQIDADYTYSFLSPKYSFKLNSISDDTILVPILTSTLAHKYYFPNITERIISSISPAERNTLELNNYMHAFKANYITSVDVLSTDLGTPTIIYKQSIVTLEDTYIYSYYYNNYTSFVCISSDNKVIIPENISTVLKDTNKYISYLTFTTPFSGTIYTKTAASTANYPVSGLFTVITHSLAKYPQVILDDSVVSLLDDVHYIDGNRLELSFSSTVNTSVTLV